jgi:hypothetical protein
MVTPIRCQIDASYRHRIREIGQHEAGHYMAARHARFKAGGITLTIIDNKGGHKAGSEIAPACSLQGDLDITSYLERRVTVLYAGALAESLLNGSVRNDLALKCVRFEGGIRDYDKARELIHLIRNIKFATAITEDDIQAGLDSIDKELWSRATRIVENEHEMIKALGSRLASEFTYVGQTVTLSENVLDKIYMNRPSILSKG